MNERLLIRFVGLELFAGRTTELFLVAFFDIVPPNANSPNLYLTSAILAGKVASRGIHVAANDTIGALDLLST